MSLISRHCRWAMASALPIVVCVNLISLNADKRVLTHPQNLLPHRRETVPVIGLKRETHWHHERPVVRTDQPAKTQAHEKIPARLVRMVVSMLPCLRPGSSASLHQSSEASERQEHRLQFFASGPPGIRTSRESRFWSISIQIKLTLLRHFWEYLVESQGLVFRMT
jgi:hypothetical protein